LLAEKTAKPAVDFGRIRPPFSPLQKMALAKLRGQTPKRNVEEPAVAMLVMGDKDKRRRWLRPNIIPFLSKEMIMDNWVYRQGFKKGFVQGLAIALVLRYEMRFGAMPAPLRERVQAAHDRELVEQWCALVAHGTREDVDRALGQR